MRMMKAINFLKPKVMEVTQVERPRITDDEVLCRVKSCGICGSDIHIWAGEHWLPKSWPMPPGGRGHETGAVVVEVGTNVEGIKIGDRVARMGCGYAQYSKEVNVLGHGFDSDKKRLPIVCNELTCEEISFADAVGCAANCVVQSELQEGNVGVLLGQGPIGLIATQLLRRKNVQLVVTDISEKKLNLAASYGVKAVKAEGDYISKIFKMVGEADVVMEMVGEQSTLDAAVKLVKRGGKILVFGAQQEMCLRYGDMRQKGIEMRFPEAMFDSQRGVDYWEEALRIIKNREVDVASLITMRVPLDELPEIFANYDRELD